MANIDAIVVGNMDHFESINNVDMWSVDGSGGYMKPIMKVTTGGTTGSAIGHAGFYHAASGLFDTVLVIGWEQNSESDTTAAISTCFDPVTEREFTAGAIGPLAAQYTAYMNKYGATEEDAALVSVRDHNNAASYNPYAHLRQTIAVGDVMKSAYVSYPIKLLDMCPRSDGACAVIFAEEDRARKIVDRPAWILGVGDCHILVHLADGIGLAVCRELSPILGSVLVAGRSGAAFTAQIGTMKVEEEIDAISTLGLSPLQVLVLPRLVALMVALPLLVFVGDVAGIAGGMLIGTWQLDIAPQVFIDRVHGVLTMQHVVVGLAKAPVFAVFIALIACRMGLVVARDARSIGENTTSTVVQCIVAVIVLDAMFAVALQHLGI